MNSTGQTRSLLLIGFGGLLLLLAFAGWNAIVVVAKIQARSERIRKDYVLRERVLEQLRSDIYLSGTYVRDLLLEPQPALAAKHRQEFESARERIRKNSRAYAAIQPPEQQEAFREFNKELNSYFDSLSPALRWTSQERRELGYSFMRDLLLPRRATIVQVTDRLSELNQKQLEVGDRQVRELFASFQQSLLVMMVILLLGGASLAGVSMYRILRLERTSLVRFQEVQRARGALQELSARVLEVQEAERRAVARELHDEVGQSLSGLLLGIGNVAATLSSREDSAVLSQLRELRSSAEKTVAAVRDISLLLRPSMLDDLGLLPALEWQAREISRTRNISVKVFAETDGEDLPEEYKTCIYRIVQEALQNVVRHAQAQAVEIHLNQRRFSGANAALRLMIKDDGRGFRPAREKGLGLLGMEERIKRLDGSFRVVSEPGRGATIFVDLPARDVDERAPHREEEASANQTQKASVT